MMFPTIRWSAATRHRPSSDTRQMPQLTNPDLNDAYGSAIFDYYSGLDAIETVERNDGFITASSGPAIYFAEYRDWHLQEQQALQQVSGRILDIGCGAARHTLYLQDSGNEVVAIDSSPLAVKVCKQRGARDARVMHTSEISNALGEFDSFLLMGNNFGLLRDRSYGPRLLQRLRRLAKPEATIVGQSLDPDREQNPFHLDYQQSNLSRGRMRGQYRLRLRYHEFATPWHDYLFLSPQELEELCQNTGWCLAHVSDHHQGLYTAVLSTANPN